jgi:hypothetical protein
MMRHWFWFSLDRGQTAKRVAQVSNLLYRGFPIR